MTQASLLFAFLVPLMTVALLHTCEPRDTGRPEVLR